MRAYDLARAALASQSSARPQDGALLERTAQLLAHRACCGAEHDPASGKLHGCCVVCGVPWPCEYAGKPPAPAAKVADALAELVACLAEQAAIPYGRTPDEAERAFNRRRANERRTERALTGGREALAAYLARPSCTYPACRCEGPGPDGGCGSAAIPSPDGAAG